MKQEKIILISPNISKEYHLSQGVLILGTILEAFFKVFILDIGVLKIKSKQFNQNKLIKHILSLNPSVVTFSTMSNNILEFINLSKEIKSLNSNIKIVFGGPYASLTGASLLKTYNFIDIICLGESETYFLELIKNIRNIENLKSIKGIIFRYNNKIYNNGFTNQILDLNNIKKNYYLISHIQKLSLWEIEIGRGCPYNCYFCSSKTFWQRTFRLKKLNNILNSIKFIQKEFKNNNFCFTHDSFTSDKKFIIDFCKLIISNKLFINWECSSRLDLISEDLLSYMINSGCKSIFFGIETGSEKLQKIIGKNLSIIQIKENIKLIKKYNLETPVFSFIFGFPEETEKDFHETLNLIEYIWNIGFDFIQLHLCSFLPGTEIYQKYKNELFFSKNIISDISEYHNYNKKNYIEIEKHKDLFCHLYNYNSTVRTKYVYMPILIRMVNNSFFSLTLHVLRKIYNNNFQKLYSELLKDNEETFKKIYFMSISKDFKTYIKQNLIFLEILDRYFQSKKLPYFLTNIFKEDIYTLLNIAHDPLNFDYVKKNKKIIATLSLEDIEIFFKDNNI